MSQSSQIPSPRVVQRNACRDSRDSRSFSNFVTGTTGTSKLPPAPGTLRNPVLARFGTVPLFLFITFIFFFFFVSYILVSLFFYVQVLTNSKDPPQPRCPPTNTEPSRLHTTPPSGTLSLTTTSPHLSPVYRELFLLTVLDSFSQYLCLFLYLAFLFLVDILFN